MTIRIGTRGSQLALWQANEVQRLLANAGHDAETVVVKTTGDRRQDVPLAAIGGKGLFIKELEEALEQNAVDLAVHSLKDMPSLIPEQFALAAFLERADPRDAWIQVDGRSIDDMPDGAIIGTSAPRRRAQLAQLYPRLQIADIRGNVDTRIRKAREGQYAGLVLAAAGITRLGRANEITSYFAIEEMLPAAGQGIVAIECLAANHRMRELVRAINHEPSETAARIERAVLERFGERLDCYSPVAVHCYGVRWPQPPLSDATSESGGYGHRTPYTVNALVCGVRAHAVGHGAEELIDTVYEQLIAQGAEKLL
ncbi:MAG TPA: hydroxymethylbilane synthase [Thermoanaerobaculia bacterium]|nr:hydroxymethylbilane synthase [Thermoanaerobaculia bacterium]